MFVVIECQGQHLRKIELQLKRLEKRDDLAFETCHNVRQSYSSEEVQTVHTGFALTTVLSINKQQASFQLCNMPTIMDWIGSKLGYISVLDTYCIYDI